MPDGKLFNAAIECDPMLEKSDSIFENSKKINFFASENVYTQYARYILEVA